MAGFSKACSRSPAHRDTVQMSSCPLCRHRAHTAESTIHPAQRGAAFGFPVPGHVFKTHLGSPPPARLGGEPAPLPAGGGGACLLPSPLSSSPGRWLWHGTRKRWNDRANRSQTDEYPHSEERAQLLSSLSGIVRKPWGFRRAGGVQCKSGEAC